jgi:hypothetical protein
MNLRYIGFVIFLVFTHITALAQFPTTGIALNALGTSPFAGFNLHQQIFAIRRPDGLTRPAFEVSGGAGYIPYVCLLGPCDRTGHFTLSYSALLLWGKRWQAELGYTGLHKNEEQFLGENTRLNGVLGGVRFRITPRMAVRGYTVGYFYNLTNAHGDINGNLIRERQTHLLLWPGASVITFF